MKDKQAATALAALEKLRLEEQMELLEAQRAEELGSLKVALEKLRSITYENNIDWRETLLAQQTEENTDNRNLTDEQFVEALHIVNDKTADKVTVGEFEILLRNFCDYKGDVRISHFLRALNIGPPTDHADPELMFDELPQPYKLIVEVLEEDILDASWEIIDEKYQLSAGNAVLDDDKEDGEEVQRIALAMSTPCFPVATSRVEGSPSCVNYSKDGKLCIIGTTNGTVKLFGNSGAQAIATLPVFPDSHGGIACISEIVESEGFEVTGDTPKLVAVAASQMTHEAFLLKTSGSEADKDSDAKNSKSKKKDKKAAKGGKDEGEASDDVIGGFVNIYELWETEPRFTLVATLAVKSDVHSVVISPASKYLSVSCVDGCVEVYSIPDRPLPPHIDNVDSSVVGKMEPVAEEQELAEVEEGEEGNVVPSRYSREKITLERTVLKINLTLEDRLGVFKPTNSVTESKINALSVESEAGDEMGDEGDNNGRNSKAGSRPPSQAKSVSSEASSLSESKSVDPCGIVNFIQTPVSTLNNKRSSKFLTTGLLVWWPGSNRLKRYFLDNKVTSNAQGEGIEEAKQHGKHHKVLHTEWFFASAITSTCVDVSCSIVAVGLSDGSVIVWDIHTGRRRAQFRRHTGLHGNRAAVCSIAIWGQRYVVSGAMDGSIQINDMLNGDIETICRNIMWNQRDSSQPKSANIGSESQMIAMREKDGSSAILDLTCLTDIPIAVAACEDDNGVVTLRLYDLPSGTFMGVIDFRDNKNVDLEACKWMFGQITDSLGMDGMDARPHGDAFRGALTSMKRVSGRGVVVNGGKKALGPRVIFVSAKGSNIYVLCSDKMEAKAARDYQPPEKTVPSEDAEDENINSTEDLRPTISYKMNIYEDWKLICDAYPAIASTCQNGTDIPHNAKRLFMITTSEQRSDPNADLEAFLLGPPGLHPKPYGNAVPPQSRPTNVASSIRSGNRQEHTLVENQTAVKLVVAQHHLHHNRSRGENSRISISQVEGRRSNQTRSKVTNTVGGNSTLSMKSRDASILISAAVGPLALNADAGQYKLSEPCLNDGKKSSCAIQKYEKRFS